MVVCSALVSYAGWDAAVSGLHMSRSGLTYRDFDYIGGNEVEIFQPPQDGPKLSRGPSSGLWGACSGRKGRVKRVNVDRQVHGSRGTDTVHNLLNDPRCANGVDLSGFDNLESAVAVVVVIAGSTEGGPDAGVDVGIVDQEALHGGVVEVCAVVDAGSLGWRAAKYLGFPCILLDLGRVGLWAVTYMCLGDYRNESP